MDDLYTLWEKRVWKRKYIVHGGFNEWEKDKGKSVWKFEEKCLDIVRYNK